MVVAVVLVVAVLAVVVWAACQPTRRGSAEVIDAHPGPHYRPPAMALEDYPTTGPGA